MIFDQYSSKCRGCRARIFFAYSDAGRQMIIHAAPVPNPHTDIKPNVKLEERKGSNGQKYLHASILRVDADDQPSIFEDKDDLIERAKYNYVDHHALCPNAKDFR